MEALGASATVALVQGAVERFLESREGRARVAQTFQPLSRSGKAAAKRWLKDPSVEILLLSGNVEQHRQAELRLRDAIIEAGEDPPDELGSITNAASRLLVEQVPPTPEIRALGDRLGQQLEAQERRESVQLEQLQSELREGLASLPGAQDNAGRDLHPRVAHALGHADDQQSAHDTGNRLREIPSRRGLDQLLSRLTSCADPHVWEAVAHYASLRGWNHLAQKAFQGAADRSAKPERLLPWAAWNAKVRGDVEAARSLLTQSDPPQDERIYRAVSAAVDGESFDDVDGLTFTQPEHMLAALVGIETLSAAGDNDGALEVVTRWRGVDDSPTAKAVEAQVRWVRARYGPPPERLAESQRALSLALSAWEETHAFDLPAPLAARTAVQAAVELNRLEALSDILAVDNPYRAEELSDSDAAAHAQLALEVLQEDADLGEQLSPFDRRLFALFRPVVTDLQAPHPRVEELLELLGLAATPTQTTRALLLLARAGHLDQTEELEQLDEHDPASAALVRAAYLSSRGDAEGAVARLRPFAGQHAGAASELVHVYERAEDRWTPLARRLTYGSGIATPSA